MKRAIGTAAQRIGALIIMLSFATPSSPFGGAAPEVTPSPSSSPSASPLPLDLPSQSPSASPSALATATPAVSSSPTPTPDPDLHHMVFTATGPLTAAFVTPALGDAAPIPAAQVTVETQRGAGIELLANGVPIDNKHLGKRLINNKTGMTQYFYYGVPLVPGPNTLTATPIGANDSRGTPVTTTVYGPGEAATVRAEFVQHIIADGRTVAPMNISVSDRYGHAAAPSERVEVSILSGDVHFVDAPQEIAPSAPGATPAPNVTPSSTSQAGKNATLPLPVGAYVALRVQPGTVAGPFEVEIRVGSAHLRRSFYVEPYVRPAFVNGLASIGTGNVPAQIDGDGINDGGGARRNRGALFATGAVGRSLVTVAYESQNRLSPVSSFGPFTADPNERPYLTYGDSSQVVDPYHSQDHLFARVDRGRSSVMWGQYTVSVGSQDVGSYQQLLSGAKADLTLGASGRANVIGFTARNDHAFASEVLPLTGLAVLVQPLHPDIVVASDALQLVTLDRHTGLVISETPLLRNVDYSIDYATGILRFINIPLPYDAQFNPQVVSLQYEYQGPGVQSQTTGGQIKYQLSNDRHTTLLGSYVNDATGTQNFALTSQSLARNWGNGSIVVSHASSVGVLPDAGNLAEIGNAVVPHNGNAYAFSFNNRTPSDAIALSYQAATAGYTDPFGGFSVPGTEAYRGSWTHGSQAAGALTVTYSGQRNTGIGVTGHQSDFALQYQRSIGRYLTGILGLQQHEQNVSSSVTAANGTSVTNTSQTQLDAGLQYKRPKGLALSFNEVLTLSGSDIGSTQPSQTTLEASYELAKRGRLFARELWSDQPSATFANSTSNLNISNSSTHAFAFGIEQPLSPAMTISSQYAVERTASGLNAYEATGVEEHLRLSNHLSANLQLQGANAVGAGAQGFTLLGGTFNYAGFADGLRASLSYQDRTGALSGATLSAGLAGHITENLSTVGFLQRAYGNGMDVINDRISFAYRSASNDRFISLLDYNRTNGSLENGEAANVVSFEELFRPTHRFELAGRFAYKFDGGGDYVARTTLLSLRARQTIGTNYDLGAEVRTVKVPGATGARNTELSVEVGRTLGRTARLGVGYNVSGSVDPTLVGTPQKHGFYMNFTTVIDRIFGWGKP